jgi:hypothetical protein
MGFCMAFPSKMEPQNIPTAMLEKFTGKQEKKT